MAEVTYLGKLLDETAQRDAVHIAVAPVVAGHILTPGEHVGFMLDNDKETVGRSQTRIGIVDPFLNAAVMPGQRFWLFLYPQTITSLRHNWTHPAFDEEAPASHVVLSKRASEEWLRDFVDRSNCPNYETLIATVIDNKNSEYLHFNGYDAHGDIPSEFWDHAEIVTGKSMRARPTYFSCSC